MMRLCLLFLCASLFRILSLLALLILFGAAGCSFCRGSQELGPHVAVSSKQEVASSHVALLVYVP